LLPEAFLGGPIAPVGPLAATSIDPVNHPKSTWSSAPHLRECVSAASSRLKPTPTLSDTEIQVLKLLEATENLLMALLAIATLFLVSFEVVTRYFFPEHLSDWGMEFTIYFTVWAIFIAGAPLVREARHVRADILLMLLPPAAQRILEIVALLIGLGFACALTWYGWEMVGNAYGLGERSESSMRFPLWIYYMALPLGATLMIFPFIKRLYLYIFCFDPETMLVTYEHIARDK